MNEEGKRKVAEAMRRVWAERKEAGLIDLVQQKQSLGAKRMWADRTEEEKKRIGKAISEGRKAAAKLRKEGKKNE